MRMLTESLPQFERVIRRRRFGFQSFIYSPKEYADPLQEKYCSICNKNFHFFRRDFYCQLCGHKVCGDCSDLHEVEARTGEIRKNRCCRQCVVRVDACKFDDEDLVPALGPIIVETPSEAWLLPSESSILSSASSDSELSVHENLADQLCSDDPETRSRELEILGALVGSSSSSASSSSASSQSAGVDNTKPKHKHKRKTSCKKTQVQDVLSSIEELFKSRLQYTVDACDVSDRTRDYKYEFDTLKVTNEGIPLAPMPEAQKDARRVEFFKNSGALQPEYDRSVLNLIAQVAAKRLGCPIGVVSMIDDEQFHAVGNYNLSPEAHHLPRNEVPCMHSLYAEKPLVIKNPQRDMRFAKMPCVDDMGVKFYAGFPLRATSGEVVGNVCALDGVAHNNISTKDYCTMQTLAKLASDLLQTSTQANST